jgi:hypothetical protein
MAYGGWGMRSRFVLGVAATVLLATTELTSASTMTLNFDGLPSMDYNAGASIPDAAQLSTQYLTTYGVSFTSGSSYVAVVDLGVGHATSGTNGIGGSTPDGILTYAQQNPITATFFDPSNPTVVGTTDFVSLRGDLAGTSTQLVTLNAYDVNNQLIATFTTADIGGETLSVAVPGIHSVQFLGSLGDIPGVAVDDFTFNSVTVAVPFKPSIWANLIFGFLGLGWMAYRRKNQSALTTA